MWAVCCKKVSLVCVCVCGGCLTFGRLELLSVFSHILKISGGNVPADVCLEAKDRRVKDSSVCSVNSLCPLTTDDF